MTVTASETGLLDIIPDASNKSILIDNAPDNIISYLVGKYTGLDCFLSGDNEKKCFFLPRDSQKEYLYLPVIFWYQGGPLIEQYEIAVQPNIERSESMPERWVAFLLGEDRISSLSYSDNPLKAAMCALLKAKGNISEIIVDDIIVQARLDNIIDHQTSK